MSRKQDCEIAAYYAKKGATAEINLFCEIMEWSKEDVFFVADDPHGVVSLGDYFFNMSDIHEVIENYPKHISRYGSDKELSNAIIRWYDWTIDYHCKHPQMEWQKVERFNALTNKTEYNVPPIQEGNTSTDVVILYETKDYGRYYGLYDGKTNRFSSPVTMTEFYPNEVEYWMEVHEPTDEHYINLSSWLKGADELVEKGE